jgi:large subunit ribosomal protein L25
MAIRAPSVMVIPGGVAEIELNIGDRVMSNQLTLTAETRDRAGKGASRELRRNGRVPAVIYGGNEEPQIIHVEAKLLMKQLMTGEFFDSEILIEVGGKTITTLPKDVAFHPVKDTPIHADFLRKA